MDSVAVHLHGSLCDLVLCFTALREARARLVVTRLGSLRNKPSLRMHSPIRGVGGSMVIFVQRDGDAGDTTQWTRLAMSIVQRIHMMEQHSIRVSIFKFLEGAFESTYLVK